MATQMRAPSKIYELYVELQYIEPLIWRRLLVPAAISLAKLHSLLQLAMGWTNSHLHSFTFGHETYGMAGTDALGELGMRDERRKTLQTLLKDGRREFLYEYDFGDSWVCRIIVTPARHADPEWHYPLCTGGARAAPPDDVGGPAGYERFLTVLDNPDDEEHESTLVWIGGAFDPEGFDLNAINRTLRFGRR